MRKFIRYIINHLPRPVIQRVVHFVTPIVGLLYLGHGVECSICGTKRRKFLPYGYGRMRENALCPNCLSLERHRMIWLYLKGETNLFTSKPKVLHIAPERCFIKRFERELRDNYITADLESPLAKVKMDVQAMPFEEGSFDVVICNHILEHVDDDWLALSEIKRVLKPDGWALVLSPINYALKQTYEDSSITTPEGRKKAFRQYDHQRDYGLDYPDRLAMAGFEVTQLDYGNMVDAKYKAAGEKLYKVTKRV